MNRKLLGAVGVVIAVLVGSLAGSGAADAHGKRPAPRPVIFVHGGSGSGAQFDTQSLRLMSNGYPADRIAVHEYDSTFGTNTMEEVWAGLDDLIAELLHETGATFTERVMELRLQKARAVLSDPRDARSIADIALDCGFSDISYFNRCFRRSFGDTPGGLRGHTTRSY